MDDDDAAPVTSFPGIELRISINRRPIVHADSVRLHYIAKYAGLRDMEWHELLRGALGSAELNGLAAVHICDTCKAGAGEFSIEIRPVQLSEPPETDGDDDDAS